MVKTVSKYSSQPNIMENKQMLNAITADGEKSNEKSMGKDYTEKKVQMTTN